MLIRALVLIAVTAARLAAQTGTAASYPPPGRVVDIGGRKLHISCTGSGSPTVVLIAGGSAFSIDWALVQKPLAATTRVCAYDRAGLGWSDRGPKDETVEQTVADLHLLLQKAGERGPFVLTGASIAGIFIRAYQHAWPRDVAALVFDNSAHRIGTYVNGRGALIWDFTDDELRSGFPLPPTVKKGPAPTREKEPFDRLPADLQAARLFLDIRLWENQDPATATSDANVSWRREFVREFEEQDAATGRGAPLGSLPLVVVASDSAAPDSTRARKEMNDLVHLSSNSVHIVATGSCHEIHLCQPDVMVDALRRVVAAVRGKQPVR